jgi:predicted O-methyltransferase YrrM
VPPAAGVVSWVPEDLHAWQVLRPLLDAGPYLPWSAGAMRPGGLVDLCNEIVLGGRRRVLELGAGASTVLLARLLAQEGGTLEAVEHDAGWAAWVTARLAREGLDGIARVTHAALEPSEHAADGLDWYAADALAAALDGPPPDLMVVDGPPADGPGQGAARLPALLALQDRLAPGATVVLDDVVRPGEAGVLRAWEGETDWRFDRRELQAIAVGHRRAAGAVVSGPSVDASDTHGRPRATRRSTG